MALIWKTFALLLALMLGAAPAGALFPHDPAHAVSRPLMPAQEHAFSPRFDGENAKAIMPANSLLARPPAGTGWGSGADICGGRPVMRWSLSTKFNWWLAQLHDERGAFAKSEAFLVGAFFLTAFALGRIVQRGRLHVNYARKLLGAAMLAAPILAATYLPYTATPVSVGASFLVFLVCLAAFAEPLRRRSPFLETAFAAIDRPEDRPHTLTWFVTAYIASSILLMVMMWWAVPAFPAYVGIALAAVAVGDLLAGAVGTRYGTVKYATRALFTDRMYTRSLQGSACVFLTTLVAVSVFGSALPHGQWLAALFVLPAAMTLAEAKSPHTWDEPVMFAVAIAVSMTIMKVWQATACFAP